jgi:hypothetical protein
LGFNNIPFSDLMDTAFEVRNDRRTMLYSRLIFSFVTNQKENIELETLRNISMNSVLLQIERRTVDHRIFELMRTERRGLITGEHIEMNPWFFMHGCYLAFESSWEEKIW